MSECVRINGERQRTSGAHQAAVPTGEELSTTSHLSGMPEFFGEGISNTLRFSLASPKSDSFAVYFSSS